MRDFGRIGDYIGPVAVKQLSAVDIDSKRSNQHEFGDRNGAIRRILGDSDRKASEGNGIQTRIMYLSDDSDPVVSETETTWYDTRRKQSNRSPEWRLYYQDSEATRLAQAGDSMFLALLKKGDQKDNLLIIITQCGSSAESQTRAMFHLPVRESGGFEVSDTTSETVDVFYSQILDGLGIITQTSDDTLLTKMVERWGYEFPTNAAFAEFAQSSLSDADAANDDSDELLIRYYEQEYKLFKIFEEEIIKHEYRENPFADGATIDVESFTKYYIKVRNRRMSRAGSSLELHITKILDAKNIKYAAQAHTENGKRPDFLFPSQAAYNDPDFEEDRLRMLAAKTSLKDRFRQVSDEADRISHKHLITITPNDVTENKLQQLEQLNIMLVLPSGIQQTYTDAIGNRSITFSEFLREIEALQNE